MSRNYKPALLRRVNRLAGSIIRKVDNKPIELWSNKVIWEKISYVHNNPVEAGLVFRAQDYVYSRASDYADGKGLLDDIVVFRYYG